MRDIDFFSRFLCLKKPWKVSRVSLSSKEKEIDIWLEHSSRAEFGCLECRLPLPLYDHAPTMLFASCVELTSASLVLDVVDGGCELAAQPAGDAVCVVCSGTGWTQTPRSIELGYTITAEPGARLLADVCRRFSSEILKLEAEVISQRVPLPCRKRGPVV